MQKQHILRPQMRLAERPPEERLRAAFGMKGYAIFTLKQRFGTGFVALRLDSPQLSSVCVRTRRAGRFEVQHLEHPSSVQPKTVEEVKAWSKVEFSQRELPFNATEPGGPFQWNELVPAEELLELGLSPREARKVAPVKRYRAGPEGYISRHLRGEVEPREPLPRMLRIGSRRRRNIVLGGGRNFPRLGPG